MNATTTTQAQAIISTETTGANCWGMTIDAKRIKRTLGLEINRLILHVEKSDERDALFCKLATLKIELSDKIDEMLAFSETNECELTFAS